MKILIVGLGKVGTSLTEQLIKEKHQVTVLDVNADLVRTITNKYDCMGMVGNGASYSVLTEAGLDSADLLIAVTGSDEMNLLCCIIAKRSGDHNLNTIARIRNPLYSKDINAIRNRLGIAMFINPEYAAAKELSHVFRIPSAIKVDTFAKGRIDLLTFRIAQGSVLNGMSLIDIRSKLHCDVLVCSVERDDTVTIPNGSFVLREKDIISFIAEPKAASEFFKAAGERAVGIKSAMLVGGGQLCYYLAEELLSLGIDVKIIEQKKSRCEELAELLPKASIICGNGTDKTLLREEGMESVDSFASLTNLDEENIMLSLYVKSKSDAKLVTKISKITFDDVVDSLELGSITNPNHVTSENIVRYVRAMDNSLASNVETLYKLNDDRLEALEFYISKTNVLTGRPIMELKLKPGLLIGAINRRGRIITPRGSDTIEVGDTVIIVTSLKGFDDITDILDTGILSRAKSAEEQISQAGKNKSRKKKVKKTGK